MRGSGSVFGKWIRIHNTAVKSNNNWRLLVAVFLTCMFPLVRIQFGLKSNNYWGLLVAVCFLPVCFRLWESSLDSIVIITEDCWWQCVSYPYVSACENPVWTEWRNLCRSRHRTACNRLKLRKSYRCCPLYWGGKIWRQNKLIQPYGTVPRNYSKIMPMRHALDRRFCPVTGFCESEPFLTCIRQGFGAGLFWDGSGSGNLQPGAGSGSW